MKELLPGKVAEFLDRVYFMNTIQDYLISIFTVLIGMAIIKVVREKIKSKLAISENVYSRYILGLDSYAYPILFLLIIFAAFQWLSFSANIRVFLNRTFTVAFIFLAIRFITAGVRHAIQSYIAAHDDSGQKPKQVKGIILVLNAILWVLGLIFLFDNLGFNVTAVLTGLGVGGIAIALAAQTVLGDLFEYFVIFFDRPFEIGDFIIVDDKLGTVQSIGLKTTRVKSLSGEQIIFSNRNLTNSRVHNYKKMLERRIVFKIRVVYETPQEKFEQIPTIIRSIIENENNTRFDRAHFSSFGEYSLEFEIVYYVLSGDYNLYMDIQQKINLAIHKAFKRNGIEFAFPTYAVNMRKEVPSEQNWSEAVSS